MGRSAAPARATVPRPRQTQSTSRDDGANPTILGQPDNWLLGRLTQYLACEAFSPRGFRVSCLKGKRDAPPETILKACPCWQNRALYTDFYVFPAKHVYSLQFRTRLCAFRPRNPSASCLPRQS